MGERPNILNQLGQAATDVLTRGTEIANDSLELFVLQKPFEDLQKTKNYFNEHKEELKEISTDDPKESKRKVDEANTYLVSAIDAVTKIQASNLRFSDVFLGATIAQLNSTLQNLKTNQAYQKYNEEGLLGRARRAAAKILTPNKAALVESLVIAEGNMTALNIGLNNLIVVPPEIQPNEQSNNKALNMLLPVLNAKNTNDRFSQIAIAISKLPGAGEVINAGKQIPVINDVLHGLGF